MNPTAHRLGSVWVNHLGFACRSLKHVIVAGHRPQRFEVQNMALNRPAGMGERENFQAILEGVLTPVSSPLGDYSVGDFSSIEKPASTE
jgi:hypothetical protein